MITIISATNRPDSLTLKVSRIYAQALAKQGFSVKIFSLEDLDVNDIIAGSFGKVSEKLQKVAQTHIGNSEKIVIISPEYNGSFPGIFKFFIDACDPKTFKGKKIALVGVASGRAGNLRGLDHLTDIFHHLEAEVLSLKVPISKIHELIDLEGTMNDNATEKVINQQISKFLNF